MEIHNTHASTVTVCVHMPLVIGQLLITIYLLGIPWKEVLHRWLLIWPYLYLLLGSRTGPVGLCPCKIPGGSQFESRLGTNNFSISQTSSKKKPVWFRLIPFIWKDDARTSNRFESQVTWNTKVTLSGNASTGLEKGKSGLSRKRRETIRAI